MADLVELIANSPTPGALVPVAALAQPMLDSSGQTLYVDRPAPAELQAPQSQFRIVIDSEIMVAVAGQGSNIWTVQRGAEGSTAIGHAAGTPVYHFLTAGALLALIEQHSAAQAAGVQSVAAADTTITMGGTGSNPTIKVTDGKYEAAGTAANLFAQSEQMSRKNAPNGYAGLGSDGFLLTSLIPALALTDPHTVNSQAAMLSIPGAHEGTVAVRTDAGKTFICGTGDPTQLASWTEMPAVGDVVSVNGQQGVINLGAADVGAEPAGDVAALQQQSTTIVFHGAATTPTRPNFGHVIWVGSVQPSTFQDGADLLIRTS